MGEIESRGYQGNVVSILNNNYRERVIKTYIS